ncbi:BLUF domain-containing protein [Pseudotabrizicola formosa]|uniref:BLUF domain-containing protein n=1 Tax=Pseudotabrizicola formosa TaxID=2030009 RepID=UPI000CD1DAF1|nr:BLUF domain-containing protein [Pseudotabrizicola formosa]
MLHHLAYASAAPEPVCPARLADLLDVSVRNNTRDGISGVLLYHDQSFFQVLEGERQAVEQCYMRILGDSRHSGVLRLWSQRVEERVFSHWAMGYAGPDQLPQVQSSAQDRLIRLLRLREAGPANEPVALALTRQMYKRFRFGMMRYSGPILT